MAFGVVALTLLMLPGTALGFHGASLTVDFAASKMIGRIRAQHRRGTIHRGVFQDSFDGGHGHYYPPENGALSNNAIGNAASPAPRPSRAESKRISTIQRAILDVTSSRVPKFLVCAFRIFSSLMLSMSLFLSIPAQSSWARNGSDLHSSLLDRARSAPSSSSPHYHYLRSNPNRNNPPMQTNDNEVASIIQTTRGSRKFSSEGLYPKGKISERRSADERRGRGGDRSRGGRGGIEERSVVRISLPILATTVAASTLRASSRRRSRTVREVTPFGIIRNQSPLGNGVSVIRVRVALGFDGDGGGDIERGDGGGAAADAGARSLLRRLHLEEKDLYARTAILASQQQQPRGTMDAHHSRRQKALVDCLSNGEFAGPKTCLKHIVLRIFSRFQQFATFP
jgi:hypothetical protein